MISGSDEAIPPWSGAVEPLKYGHTPGRTNARFLTGALRRPRQSGPRVPAGSCVMKPTTGLFCDNSIKLLYQTAAGIAPVAYGPVTNDGGLLDPVSAQEVSA